MQTASISPPTTVLVTESAVRSLIAMRVSATAVATTTFCATIWRKRYHQPLTAAFGVGKVNVIEPDAPWLVNVVPARSRGGRIV